MRSKKNFILSGKYLSIIILITFLIISLSHERVDASVIRGARASEPTPAPAQVKVVSSSSYLSYEKYKELMTGKVYEGDMFHVVGEIQNIGSTNVEDVRIRPTFFDAGGSVIEAGPIHTSLEPLDILPPDQRSPFELILLDEEASSMVEDYNLSVEFNPTTEKPYILDIVNHSSTILTYYKVFGEVVNMNPISVASVKLLATFYDEEGTVITADRTWIDFQNLLPGRSFPFELSNHPRNEITDKIKSYRVCAQCRIGVEIPYTEFQVLSSESEVTEWGQYVVSGEIKNTGSQDATSVSVYVTFYDSDDKVVEYDFSLPDPIDVAAGQTATFEVRQIYKELTPRITSSSVQVHCRGTGGASSEITREITDPSFPSYLTPTIILGDSMAVSGSITPPRANVEAMLTYRRQDGTAIRRAVTTNTTGDFTDIFTPDEVGRWGVIAAWPGDEEYKGAYMFIWKSFEVKEVPPDEEPPTVSNVEVNPSTGVMGTTFTITAEVDDATGVKLVMAHLSHEGREITEFELFDDGKHGDEAAEDGIYGDTWDSNYPTGTYSIMIYAEDSLGNSRDYFDLASFIVPRTSSSISCSVSPSMVTKGDSVTVSGSINPAVSGKSVTLTYERPDGSTFTRMVTSGSDGGYSDSYQPTEAGSWSVNASWEGDEKYEAASSQHIAFTVEEKEVPEEEKKKGCIIATATYGSELSPEVQFLRGFRDNTVLKTFAGKNFMIVFNAWYYSFSPRVASAITVNYALRGFMKILLYPLIGILHLAQITYSLFCFNPEFAIVVSGLVTSSLIGIAYFAPCTLIPCLIKKMKVPKWALRLLSLFWFLSIGFTTAAEVSKEPSLMMFSTAILVLTTISYTTLFFGRYIIHTRARCRLSDNGTIMYSGISPI